MRSGGGRGARGPGGRVTARSVPAVHAPSPSAPSPSAGARRSRSRSTALGVALALATGSLLLLLAGPAPPGAAAQPLPGALPGPVAAAGRARPLPRCATARVASDACKVRPGGKAVVFRDPTVTVQRDGAAAVEMRPREFSKRWLQDIWIALYEAYMPTIFIIYPDLLFEAIKASPLITGTLAFPICAPDQGTTRNNCVALAFKKFKKRIPKLVLEVPAGNWQDLAALGRSLGACTMQVRTPCD